MDCSLPGSSVRGISPGKNTGVGCYFPSLGDLPDPGIEPGSLASPVWQVNSLPLSHQGRACVLLVIQVRGLCLVP